MNLLDVLGSIGFLLFFACFLLIPGIIAALLLWILFRPLVLELTEQNHILHVLQGVFAGFLGLVIFLVILNTIIVIFESISFAWSN